MNTVTHNTKNAQYKTVNSSTNWFDKNQSTYSAETLENELQRRGILQSAMACRWSIAPHWLEHDDGKGMAWAWSIPTNQREYNLIKFYRPKAMRWSKTAQWQDGITKTTKVYIGQGWGRLMKAVVDSNILIVASGQVDHLTFIEAGHDNVISFYGENSVPTELLDLIQKLGNVQAVLNWPDRDKAGITGATKLRDLLHPNGVAFSAFELPYEFGTKKDTNDLWIDVAFDASRFNSALLACPLLELPSQHEATILPAVHIPTPTAGPTSKASKGQLNWDALHRDVQSRLERDYHLDRRGGCVCPMHPQTSNKRDAKLNDRSLHCFVCKTHSIADVAKRLGIQIEHYRDTIEGGATVLTLPLEQYVESLKPYRIQFTANRMIEAQYVNTVLNADILDESRLIGIKSPTGTGKTELMFELIDATPKQDKTIIITSRRKLLRNIQQRSRDNGIKATNYEDATDVELLLANTLLITVDSLPRLTKQAGFDARDYGLIILDEATQTLYHLLKSKTLMGKDRDAFMAFLQVIQHGTLLALDANLDDEAMGILAGWSTAVTNAKPPTPYNILNTYKPIKGKATQFSNLSGMIANMIDRLKKGQRIAIHAPTRQFGNWLNQQLAQYANGIYFDSHTVDFERQRQALQNLNDEAEYQFIIYSPILGTGYDITRAFDAVYLVGFGTHLTAHDWLQGVGRCRNANELVYYIRERKTKTPNDTATAVESVYQSRMQATPNATGFDALDGRALDGYAKMQASRNRMKNHPMGYWYEGIHRQGWAVPVIDDSSNQLIDVALQNMKETIKTASIAKMLPVAETEFVTDEAYNGLRRDQDRTGKQLITEQTYWANQAWGIFNLTGIPNNEQTLDYFYTPTNRNRFLAFYREHFQLAPALDEEEARRKVLVHRRQYATGKDDLLATLLRAIWGKNSLADIATLQHQFTEDEALERFIKAGLADSNGITVGLQNRLATTFNWRVDYSHKPLAVLRWVLRKYGMRLASKQHMIRGDRFYIYWFDEAEFSKLRMFALARLDYLKPDNHISLSGFKELPPALQSQPNNKTPNKGFGGMLPPQPMLNRQAVPMRE